MNPRIILVLVLALAGQLLAGAAYAENKCAGRPQNNKPLPKKEPPKIEHTTITSISAESITISEGGKAKTYKITKDTEIDMKGQKVKADDLKAGMRVSVSMAADPTVASRINASDPPKEDPKAADAAKKK
jgi:hypothetical protein